DERGRVRARAQARRRNGAAGDPAGDHRGAAAGAAPARAGAVALRRPSALLHAVTRGGSQMRIGTFVPFVSNYSSPPFIAEVARTAEALGFHSMWAPEHVLLFDEYESRYPYTEDGRLRIGPDGGVLEPFDLLAFIAAATSRIRLGTGICLVPQR